MILAPAMWRSRRKALGSASRPVLGYKMCLNRASLAVFHFHNVRYLPSDHLARPEQVAGQVRHLVGRVQEPVVALPEALCHAGAAPRDLGEGVFPEPALKH